MWAANGSKGPFASLGLSERKDEVQSKIFLSLLGEGQGGNISNHKSEVHITEPQQDHGIE